MNQNTWTGVFPAVTTQLHQDQSLDLAASALHWQAQIDVGVSGLIVCGSLGENQCLQPDEKRAVVKHAVEVAAGRVNAALSGATPYLRLISLAAGGAYLAKGALAGHDAARLNLARFYAENIIAETSILKDRVIEGSASLAAAAELLLSA